MNGDDDKKKLERQARALILSKDITISDREMINSIMKNQRLMPDEKYSSIIRLLKDAPDREIVEIDEASGGSQEEEPDQKAASKISVRRKPAIKKTAPSGAAPQSSGRPEPGSDGHDRYPDINGPTETKFFIDEIYSRYKKYKFFRKRHLVEKNSLFGIGFDKRLIPTRRFLVVMKEIQSFQERVLSRMGPILESILKLESVEGPLEFNYLRSLRRWLFNTPFSAVPWSRIKWMEHWGFERELKRFVINYFSFIRMPLEHRERVLVLVENILREEPDLLKEEMSEGDDKSVSARKEKGNYGKEKYIYEYMGAIRSFMAIPGENDSLLSRHLSNRYGVQSLGDFLNMTLEAIVFQRPFVVSELRDYYNITPMEVSSTIWDCNIEKLKLFGKDPESVRRKQAEKLKSRLVWYDTVYSLVTLEETGKNILVSAVDDLWKLVDKVNRDAGDTLKKNFIVFLEVLFHFFRELIVPFLSGEEFTVESVEGTFPVSMFTPDFFTDELHRLDSIGNELYQFRNNNPTLKISDDEVKKIMSGRISSMTHVEKLIFNSGSLFYSFASKLHAVYDGFISGETVQKYGQVPSRPLSPDDMTEPFIPYTECVVREMHRQTPLMRKLQGRRVLSDNRKGGVFIYFLAFCYQAAGLCGYPKLNDDLTKRSQLKHELNMYKEEKNG